MRFMEISAFLRNLVEDHTFTDRRISVIMSTTFGLVWNGMFWWEMDKDQEYCRTLVLAVLNVEMLVLTFSYLISYSVEKLFS
jgi:hypothetical protein